MQEIFDNLLHHHPLPSSSIDNHQEEGPPDTSSTAIVPFNTTTHGPLGGDINLEDNFDFGSARTDINKKAKRFEWTEKEISHLEHFILHIEPTLSDSERKNKYATCLAYLKRADETIQCDFHPFHCENSSRIKTGYEVAIKKIGFIRE